MAPVIDALGAEPGIDVFHMAIGKPAMQSTLPMKELACESKASQHLKRRSMPANGMPAHVGAPANAAVLRHGDPCADCRLCSDDSCQSSWSQKLRQDLRPIWGLLTG